MKKFIIAAMALTCTAAFAGEGSHGTPGNFTVAKQKQEAVSTSVSTAVSTSKGGEQGQLQGQQQAITGNSPVLTFAPVTTNVASDLKDQGATAAAISAAAAIEIAKIQADSTTRDLSADQRAALDREAAITIAKLGQTVKNTPGIVGSALVSSNDTCMGSVSVGGSGPGFSIGVGTTYTDDNCKMLKNSRELWNMGMKAASLALMCTNQANKDALELTGFVCPQTEKANKDAAAAAAVKKASVEADLTTGAYTGSDPVVQARMAATK